MSQRYTFFTLFFMQEQESKWSYGRVGHPKAYPGLAKFIRGCITKHVKSSRAMDRTTGH